MIPYDLALAIQTDVNANVTYCRDQDAYGVPEFWEAAGVTGDCEDYALIKRQKLLDAGVDHRDLRLAFCQAETGEGHAVLIVTTDRGEMVLDNRYDEPRLRSELPYHWIALQEGNEWHTIV